MQVSSQSPFKCAAIAALFAASLTLSAGASNFAPPTPGGDPPAPQGPGGGRPRSFDDLLKEFDKNGDGVLTADECGDRWERLKRLDKNGDGTVTREEFDSRTPRAPRTPRGPGAPPAPTPGTPPAPPPPPAA